MTIQTKTAASTAIWGPPALWWVSSTFMLMLGIGALTGGSVVQAVGLVAASALGAPPAQRRLIKNWDLSPPWIIGLASVALAIAAIALSPAIEGASGKPDEGKPAPTDTAAVSKLDDATKQEIQESWKLIANADALCGKATTSFGQTVNAYSKGRADGADAYRAAQSAQSVCMGSFNLIAQTEPAHKLRGAEKKAFNAALLDCSTAARLREEALGKAGKILNGDARPSATVAFQDDVAEARSESIECARGYLLASLAAGMTAEEFSPAKKTTPVAR